MERAAVDCQERDRAEVGAPNPHAVYLHDTPDHRRFDVPRRAFSHGCIRVDDVAALTTWLIDDAAAWHAGRVERAMAGPEMTELSLPRPTPVRLVYLLALVWPDGTAHFADDLYPARVGEPVARGGCPA